MQNLSEFQMDQERESAYRRGYTHGIHAAISGLVSKLSDEERGRVDSWVDEALTQWCRSVDVGTEVPPPDFPRLDRNA